MRCARSRCGVAVLVVLALLLIGLAGSAQAGDPDLAQFLLQHGRRALSKGEYDDALTKLRKAREEDPKLIEATYWVAVVHERKKDPAKAVPEYRAFQRLAKACDRDGNLKKGMAKLLKKAESRLRSLDAGNTQIDRAQSVFADRLCSTARAIATTDSNLAIRMLKVARRAAPDHNDARNMLDEMDGGFIPLAAAFDRVHDWRDLIKGSRFGENPGWTYKEKQILVVASGGSLIRPPAGYQSGPSYAYTMDVVLKKVPSSQKTMSVGLIFGLTKEEGFGAMLFHDENKEDRIGLTAVSLNPPKDRVLKILQMAKWDLGRTHRISVLVEGDRIRMYLDNNLAINHKVSGRDDLSGNIAISHQNAHLEIKQFRVGAVARGGK